MGITLDISVETPLSADDRDILAGISVMVLAIANRQDLADQPHMQGLEGEEEPCGSDSEGGTICIKEVGHVGRHKYRDLSFEAPLN
jgi:hypothetical protein